MANWVDITSGLEWGMTWYGGARAVSHVPHVKWVSHQTSSNTHTCCRALWWGGCWCHVISQVKQRKPVQNCVCWLPTKWPEVFAAPDQTHWPLPSDHVICQHGVPTEYWTPISQWKGKAFLSNLIEDIYKLMGMHKVSNTAYHSQTDGLVKWFNQTLANFAGQNCG